MTNWHPHLGQTHLIVPSVLASRLFPPRSIANFGNWYLGKWFGFTILVGVAALCVGRLSLPKWWYFWQGYFSNPVQVYLRVYTLHWFQSWSILEHVEVWDTLLLACLSLEAVGQEYLVQTSVLSRQLDILLSVALFMLFPPIHITCRWFSTSRRG